MENIETFEEALEALYGDSSELAYDSLREEFSDEEKIQSLLSYGSPTYDFTPVEERDVIIEIVDDTSDAKSKPLFVANFFGGSGLERIQYEKEMIPERKILALESEEETEENLNRRKSIKNEETINHDTDELLQNRRNDPYAAPNVPSKHTTAHYNRKS